MSGTHTLDVSILIVGYNSLGFLKDCLSSIEHACSRCSHEILFVNNGTDGSEAFIREEFPKVRVLPSRGNVGFAEGNNDLAALAAGRHLLLLNPDTRLMPHAVDVLVDFADRNPAFGILGALTLDKEGKPEEMARAALPSLSRLVGSILRIGLPPGIDPGNGAPLEVSAVNGGCMFIKRDVWDLLGGMDQDYFLYTEDLDFCQRYIKAGGRIAVLPDSQVAHHFGSGEPFSPTRRRFMLLGNATYYHKHFSPPYAFACVTALWVACVSRFVAGIMLGALSANFRKMAGAYRYGALNPLKWARGYRSPGADPRKVAGASVATL